MAPKTYKSFHYKAKTTWSSARRGMLLAAGRPNIVVGSPPDFKGEPGIWAPEELLVGELVVPELRAGRADAGGEPPGLGELGQVRVEQGAGGV